MDKTAAWKERTRIGNWNDG